MIVNIYRNLCDCLSIFSGWRAAVPQVLALSLQWRRKKALNEIGRVLMARRAMKAKVMQRVISLSPI
jgi:hypothetical protein